MKWRDGLDSEMLFASHPAIDCLSVDCLTSSFEVLAGHATHVSDVLLRLHCAVCRAY